MSQQPWDQQPQLPQLSQGYQQPGQQYHPGQEPTQPLNYAGSSPAYTHIEEQEARKKHSTGTVLTAAVLAALVGAGVGTGASLLAQPDSTSSVSTTSTGTTIVNNTDSVNEITAAAAKATPSVVTIGTTSSQAQGSGSGIILDNQGHILTNTHVVTLDGATSNARIEVQLSDGTVRKAEVVGTDPTSDLAVIKVDPSGINLTPATLGDSSKLNVGDVSIAIGAPLGLQNTVTDGIISTLSRTIEIASSEAPTDGTDSSQSNSLGKQELPFQFQLPGQQGQSPSAKSTLSINVLQTDAAVNPGNSGGALVNSQGEVIGVNVAIASAGSSTSSSTESGNIGVGFSIPINYAQRIAQEIIDTGKASHGFLGASVSTSPGNNDSSELFGDGAVVREVVSGEAAADAGLKSGDVIVEFNGHKITEATELTAAVREAKAGETVTAKIQRNNHEEEVKITLGNSEDHKN